MTIPSSKELNDLVFLALEHGVASVEKGGPLVPFVISEGPSPRTLARFVADRIEAGKAQAFAHVKGAGADRGVVAYDGDLTVEGARADAIFAEAFERGGASTMVFCQRYAPARFLRRAAAVGNVAFVGTEPPLF